MATDFNYGNTQIAASGPFKPTEKNIPIDARTRVDTYADIKTIPNPFVSMKITVLVDETNNNKMTDYIVKSLKANSYGIANTVIDEVVRYVDYLGVSSSGGGTGEGLTTEQAQQLQTAYEHSQSVHVQASDIPSKTSDLTNDSNYATETFVTSKIAEAQLDGSDVDLSGLATKDELNEKAPLTHSHNISDVSDLQTALDSKVDAVLGKSLVSDTEIARLANVDNYDDSEIRGLIPTKVSDLTNDRNYLTSIPSEYITETELNTSLSNKVDKEAGKGLSTNDLTNELVTKIDNAATQAYVTNAIAEAQLGGDEVDLSGLATKDELNAKADISAVPTKTSQLTNDSGFITTIPSEVITETELNAKSYATETFVTNKIAEASGATAEQVAQIEANKTAIGDTNSGLIKEVNDIKNTELQNLNTTIETLEKLVGIDETVGGSANLPEGDVNVIASINRLDTKIDGIGNVDLSDYATKTYTDNAISTALDGHTFKFLTQAEYDVLETKDPLVEYHITDATESGEGLTSEQAQQLQTAYAHSQSTHVQISDIPTKLSQLNNDSSFVTTTKMNTAIAQAQLSGGSVSNITYELFDDSLKSLFIIEEVE